MNELHNDEENHWKKSDSSGVWDKFELIKAVPGLRYRYVRSLSLRRMNLADVPPLTDLDLITELDLAENGIRYLPDFLLRMINLKHLNASYNILREPPKILFEGLYKLKKLDLSFNGLTYFIQEPCCLSFLEDVNLSHNQLSSPPSWLLHERPSKLVRVDLSWNPCFVNLTTILSRKPDLQISDNVRILNITSCGFKDRHIKYLENFSKLRCLIIESVLNCAKEQRNCFKEFKTLSKSIMSLNARRTGILTLAPSIVDITSLRELDISSNVLEWLPTHFGKLNKLIILKAENCRINFLPVEMNLLINLKELYLAYNELYSFDYIELKKLEVLDLYMNDLLNTPKLETLLHLKALDLDRNLFNPVKKIEIGAEEIQYEVLKKRLRSYIRTLEREEGIRPTTHKCRVTEVFERDYDEDIVETDEANDSTQNSSEERIWQLCKEREEENDLCHISSSSEESSSSQKYTSYGQGPFSEFALFRN